MREEEILEILNDWNLWKKNIYTGIKREEYIEKIKKFLKSNVVVVVTGVRRSGKSFILRQLMKKIGEKKGKNNILLVNFEDSRFTEINIESMNKIYETYLENLNPEKQPLILLDEIHRLPKWERWVRTIIELNKAKIVVSGSNSKLLKGELASLLTGRHLDIAVFPLSFKEFLKFKNFEINDRLDVIAKKIGIKRLVNEYIKFGGFPEVVLSENKKELLLNYFEDIIVKDIEHRYEIRTPKKLRAIASFCLTNVGSYISFNSLAKNFDIATDTVEKFIGYMEEVYLLFLINKFSWKVKEQEKAARKVYSIDTGLANIIGYRFSKDKGKLMENLVAIQLEREKQNNKDLEIYYWRDYQQREVDFAVKEGLNVKQLIQVTYASGRDEIEVREIKALIKASELLRCKDLLVITWDYEGEENADGKTIKFVPLWKWLINY